MIYQKKAFTLIELMVWISIISIISLWVTKLFWNKIPDKLRLDLFTNKFTWIIDSVKNYALVWKWIWPTLETPKYFKIDIARTESWKLNEVSGSGYIKTYYNTWLTDTYYAPMSLDKFANYYHISEISCKNLDLSNITSTIDNISISYEWSNIVLSWCVDNYQKIVDLELFYKWFKKILRLNVISWVLEEI
jgi:prepilin-type N-terminal cleavage/methylation domain-containing protein